MALRRLRDRDRSGPRRPRDRSRSGPTIPRVDWQRFLGGFRWRQGEHVSLIGPTGVGKTTLALQLLPARGYVVVLGTKPEDATLDRLVDEQGFRRIERWPPRPGERRVLLWPRIRKVEDVAAQAPVFRDALKSMFVERNWTVYADELRYLCGNLGLGPMFRVYWLQGRSLGLSVVGGTQRPAWVPLEAYDQASHLFVWRDNDETNVRRLGGLAGMSNHAVREAVGSLDRHETLYLDTREGRMVRTRAEAPAEAEGG